MLLSANADDTADEQMSRWADEQINRWEDADSDAAAADAHAHADYGADDGADDDDDSVDSDADIDADIFADIVSLTPNRSTRSYTIPNVPSSLEQSSSPQTWRKVKRGASKTSKLFLNSETPHH